MPIGDSNETLERRMPTIPIEIWHIILKYAVRLSDASVIEPRGPLSAAIQDDMESTQVDPSFFQDRFNLSHVCSTFRTLVTEISLEYTVIQSGQQLAYLAKLLKHSNGRLGESVLRLDLEILGKYKVKHLATFLRYAPKLLIFVNRNGRNREDLQRVPPQMMLALMTYGKNIRRIEFHSTAESPALYDLIDISRYLVKVETLHVLCVRSYPTEARTLETLPPLLFKNLRTLSLGLIPVLPEDQEAYAMTWDPLLTLLSRNPDAQLPNLTRFETDLFPAHTLRFFDRHGSKLRTFRTTTWSTSSRGILPHALAKCTNLEELILSHSTSDHVQLPGYHPAIRKICITSVMEERVEVPSRVFQFAVLRPLDQLLYNIRDEFTAPYLKEVRVRNTGAFVGLLEHPAWLEAWWRKWNVLGIKFVDKLGKEFTDESLIPDEETLLNSIRE